MPSARVEPESLGHGDGRDEATRGAGELGSRCQTGVVAPNSSDLRSRLEDARSVGRVFRQRVQHPLALGSILTGVVAVILLFADVGREAALAGNILLQVSALSTLLSVLPTDRLAMALVSVAVICFGMVTAVLFWFTTVHHMDMAFACYASVHGDLGGDRPHHGHMTTTKQADVHGPRSCFVGHTLQAVLDASGSLLVSGLATVLISHYCDESSPRRRMDSHFFCLGMASLSFAVKNVGHVVVNGVFFHLTPWTAVDRLTRALADLLVTTACLLPSVHAQVHRWLAARGEAMSSAAGIAALLDGRRPAEIQEEAGRLFRCIPAAFIRPEHFVVDSTAQGLYALTQAGHFGAVDAFLSRTCRERGGGGK